MANATATQCTCHVTHDASVLDPHLSFNFLFLLRHIQTLSIDINLSETINTTLSQIQPSIDLKRDNLALHSGFIGLIRLVKRMG